jgi:hypothetical protein
MLRYPMQQAGKKKQPDMGLQKIHTKGGGGGYGEFWR